MSWPPASVNSYHEYMNGITESKKFVGIYVIHMHVLDASAILWTLIGTKNVEISREFIFHLYRYQCSSHKGALNKTVELEAF